MRLTGYVIRDLNLDPKRFPPRSVHATISAAKNDYVGARRTPSGPQVIFERKIADVYREYQARLQQGRRHGLRRPARSTPSRCSSEHPDVLEHYRRRFKHVLVDEYQDTNRVQNELVLLLAAEHRNVCVVGDADQSIYAFRGADIRNILEFEEAFPDATVIVLEQNYRSTQTILDAANAVIANNLSRKPKELWTDRGDGQPIVRYHADDEGDEAQWVAHEIAAPARRRATPLGRRRRLLPHQRAEPRARGAPHARRASRTRSSAARGSTTGARSRTRSPTCRRSSTRSTRCRVKRVLNVPKRGIGDTHASAGSTRGPTAARRRRSSTRCAGADEAGVSGTRGQGASTRSSTLLDELAELVATTGPVALLEAAARPHPATSPSCEAEHTIEAEGRLENLAELVGAAQRVRDRSTSSSSRSASSPTPTSSTTTTPRSCS